MEKVTDIQEVMEEDEDFVIDGDTFRVRRKGYTKKKALENAHKSAKIKAAGRRYKVTEERVYAEQNYWVGVVGGVYLED